jgi:hypothetical protein
MKYDICDRGREGNESMKRGRRKSKKGTKVFLKEDKIGWPMANEEYRLAVSLGSRRQTE